MRQTSIAWLIEQMTHSKELYDDQGAANTEVWDKLLAQAMQMHKQEIVDAFYSGDFMHHHKQDIDKDGFEYYKETYGGSK
jgi:hypothetical protein